MKADEVYRSVRAFVSNHDHKLQNVFVHHWEADSFSITSSGYIYEVEVKVSRADYFNDFKKPKHHFFKTHKKGYGILNLGESWYCEGWPLTDKFPELRQYHITHTQIHPAQYSYRTCPNRFYFACPDGLIKIDEVPDYAGLIYCAEGGRHKEVKKAPYMHKDKAEPKELLFEKYYYQNINLRNKVSELESAVKYLKQRLQPV